MKHTDGNPVPGLGQTQKFKVCLILQNHISYFYI